MEKLDFLWNEIVNSDCTLCTFQLNQLSFFVLDEADRMVEKGHFKELQSIIDMIPSRENLAGNFPAKNEISPEDSKISQKKRQILVFSATLSLPPGFRRKLKKGGKWGGKEGETGGKKGGTSEGLGSVGDLIQRLKIREDCAIFDLTKKSLVAEKVEESVIQ